MAKDEIFNEMDENYFINHSQSEIGEPIAIVGVETLFAESLTNEQLWNNIVTGKDLLSDVPADHWLIEDYYDPDPKKVAKVYVTRGSFLPTVNFDPIEFGVPPTNLTATDPSQLLSLILSKRLLDTVTSIQDGKVKKDNISVILGAAVGSELLTLMSGQLCKPHWVKAMREAGLPESQVQDISDRIIKTFPDWTENTFPGLLSNVIAGRIANRLDLKGTNCVVDAACATSLASLFMGLHLLRGHSTDLVIVGGVDTFNDIVMFNCFAKTGALSLSNDCRPFDKKGDGTLLGEGIGLFALRRLEDAERDGDTIYAVIKSIGSSSDGRGLSIYAPLAKGQALAIQRAQNMAGCHPRAVELVESHGTGTAAGDAAEVEGLCTAFQFEGNQDREWCALGSIKSQLGHTKAAAGAASLFKVAMSLLHRVLPPTIKVDDPIKDFSPTPFYLNTQTRPWIHDEHSSRLAGVSSFGFGGTNFHVVVEEYQGPLAAKRFSHSPVELILLSGESFDSLQALAEDYAASSRPLKILAKESQFNFQVTDPYRLAIIIPNKTPLDKAIKQALNRISQNPEQSLSLPFDMHYQVGGEPNPQVAFLFAGQGSQYINMGSDLAIEFRDSGYIWDASLRVPFDHQPPLHQIVFPPPVFSEERRQEQEERLRQTEWAQPAIGLMSLSQLALLQKIGIQADAVAGHSYGEVTALYAAGAITSFEDFIQISRKRGELMAEAASSVDGAMTVVFCSDSQAQEILRTSNLRITIANRNSPKQTVFSGEVNQIEILEQQLQAQSISFKRLPVSTAFHSPIVEKSAKPLFDFLNELPIESPSIPVYSNTTASKYPSDPDQIRRQLAWQLARPVLFSEQIEHMYQVGIRVFIELGPQGILTNLTKACLENRDCTALAIDVKNKNGVWSFWDAVGTLATAGVPLDLMPLWEEFINPNEQVTGEKKPSKAAIKLNGAVYGNVYPPKEGASGLPKPNPESSTPASLLSHKPVIINEDAQAMRQASDKNGDQSAQQPDDSHNKPIGSPEWLKAFQELQTTAFNAQQQFQKTLAESHLSFLELTKLALQGLGQAGNLPEGQQNIDLLSSSQEQTEEKAASFAPPPSSPQSRQAPIQKKAPPPSPSFKPAPSPARPQTVSKPQPAASTAARPQPSPIATPKPTPGAASTRPGSVAAPRTAAVSTPKPASKPAPAAPKPVEQPIQASAPEPASADNFSEENKQVLFEIIADKTGYPVDILELDMELESGLGIDSIKRVEIFSDLIERFSSLQELDRNELVQLGTLREILEVIEQNAQSKKKQ